MLSKFRLSSGGEINRTERVSFKFNGKTFFGYKGDTLASALLANGVHLVGRSFKYHRPRGFLGSGSEEPNAIVQIIKDKARTEPNIRATEIEIFQGFEAKSQNCWPSVNFDVGEINNFLSPLLPAGFYYKTFMWPAKLWKTYEYFIRKSAGLGVSATERDPDLYDHKYYHCDVLIVGSGPAGLTAASIAVKSGKKVLLVDEKADHGGSLVGSDSELTKINDGTPKDWVNKTFSNLSKNKNIKILNRTTVAAYHNYNYLIMVQNLTDHLNEEEKKNKIRQRLWKVRAKKVILATGSIERTIVFDCNDRPGIMLSSAVRKYLNHFGVKCGNNVVIFANNDDAYETAISLHNKGIKIKAIIDIRENSNGYLVNKCNDLGLKILWKHAVVTTKGRKKIDKVIVMKLSNNNNSVIGNEIKIDCDLLCISGGYTPAVHLFTQSGGKLLYNENKSYFYPGKNLLEQISIGSCTGIFNIKKIIDDTYTKVNEFLKTNIKNDTLVSDMKSGGFENIWLIPSNKVPGKSKSFVDFQNDSTANDIRLALREGFRSIEHVKRYTTTGMATDQGKIANMHALGIISEHTKTKIGELGTTTFRPPYTPLTFGALVGRNVKKFFDITRKTPMHSWHEKNNAKFEDVGQWKRAWYYPIDNESMHDSVQRESKAARENAGILDASTLGKIDIQGSDASEFLNRVYTNAWNKLGIGKCRYGLMLNEDGMVYDDGVTTRLGENHYIMTTTTGGAATVMGKLEDYLQTEWPELKVFLTSVTDHFATVSLCGPYSKKILEKVVKNINFDDNNFPHMSFKEGVIDNIKCRVMRISFTGELSYEINIQANYGKAVWEKCMQAGKEFKITPYGTESMHLLRAEKGFVIVGQETDGTVTPIDLQMDWIVSKKKYDFIGKRSLYRSDTMKEGRKQMVGLLTEDPNEVLEEGAQIVAEVKKKPPMDMLGHVTSSYYSPNLKKSIALAVVKNGKNLNGKILYVPMKNKIIKVTVSDSIFIDKEGKRLNA
ncbi:sarcosine oxidase subunit alpha family protein [bacterium]|nr:sarcosine oxidase subunit alpha family protein [bacterium]